jgi:hypothetical protein
MHRACAIVAENLSIVNGPIKSIEVQLCEKYPIIAVETEREKEWDIWRNTNQEKTNEIYSDSIADMFASMELILHIFSSLGSCSDISPVHPITQFMCPFLERFANKSAGRSHAAKRG